MISQRILSELGKDSKVSNWTHVEYLWCLSVRKFWQYLQSQQEEAVHTEVSWLFSSWQLKGSFSRTIKTDHRSTKKYLERRTREQEQDLRLFSYCRNPKMLDVLDRMYRAKLSYWGLWQRGVYVRNGEIGIGVCGRKLSKPRVTKSRISYPQDCEDKG